MANPQPDKTVRISTEIWDQLCKLRIPGEARQILDFILRKTYGWNKKEDQISLRQFVEGTGLAKSHVQRGIKKLLEMNMIKVVPQKGYHEGTLYGFIKDYDQWTGTPKRVVPQKGYGGVPKKGVKWYPKRGHTIDSTIDTRTIDSKISSEILPRTPAHEAKEFFENPEIQQKAIEYLISKGIPEELAKTELQKFIAYWTELNSTGKKQRWQMEKVFELRRRFVTWFGRIKGFANKTERKRKIWN